MKNSSLLLLFFSILFLGCNNGNQTTKPETEVLASEFEKLDKIEWLLGAWINHSDAEFSRETWNREDDSTFSAFSFTQVGNDTIFSERMVLQQREKDLLLMVSDADPIGPEITFKLVSMDKGEFVFENKEHDFPERIVYTNPATDSLFAYIEGTINGERKRIPFPFSREE